MLEWSLRRRRGSQSAQLQDSRSGFCVCVEHASCVSCYLARLLFDGRARFRLVNRVVWHAACFAAVVDLVVTDFPIIGTLGARRHTHLAQIKRVSLRELHYQTFLRGNQWPLFTSFSRFAWSAVLPEFSDPQGSRSHQLVNNLPPFTTTAQVVCAAWQHQHKRYLKYGVSGCGENRPPKLLRSHCWLQKHRRPIMSRTPVPKFATDLSARSTPSCAHSCF